MSQLTLQLLGQFYVLLAQQPLTTFDSDKVRALLVYLAMEGAHAHSRSQLATLFWPGYTEESARTNLRQALRQLRLAIDDENATPPLLLITRQTIQFNPAAAVTVDALTFGQLLCTVATHAHANANTCQPCLHHLQQAVALYQGDFLAGLTLSESVGFEEWRCVRQEELHLQALHALQQLAECAEQAGDDETCQGYASRLLALEPWHEAAHRQVMRTLARRGQRSAALAQYQRCCQILADEFGVAPEPATVALYQQLQSGAMTPATTPATTPTTTKLRAAPGGNGRTAARNGLAALPSATTVALAALPRLPLPMPLTPFVERTTDLALSLARLQEPAVRLLTLIGAGGMGKTRLALEIGRRLAAAHADNDNGAPNVDCGVAPLPFPAGVIFVELASLRSANEIAPALMAALGLPLYGQDPKQALLHLLRDQALLIILDNCEHLPDVASLIAELLQAAPALRILATARGRLHVHGEHLYTVQGLPYPTTATVATAGAAAAVRLFIQSAQQVQPDFTLHAGNLAAVLRICALVQGMPLGLELAATWTDTLPLETIGREIEQNLDFLSTDWHNMPERQRSMRAVFQWSWQMLTAEEQQAFRRLAIFRGGFTRQAAAAITGASLRVLTSLVHKSLLISKPLEERYEFHELLRQFAAEALDAHPTERLAMAAAHQRFYLAFLAAYEEQLVNADLQHAVAAIQGELDNIRQAWHWAAAEGESLALAQSALALSRFYELVGLLAERTMLLHLAVDRFQHELAKGFSASVAVAQHLSKLLALCAKSLMAQGHFDEAIALAQQAVTLGTANDGVEGAASGQLIWGQSFFRKGQYREARQHFVQALQIVQGHATEKALLPLLYETENGSLGWLAAVEAELGAYQIARDYLGQVRTLCRRLGRVRAEMQVQINLAILALRQHDYATAHQTFAETLPIIHQLGDRMSEGIVYNKLGDVARLQGAYSQSYRFQQQAQTILTASGALFEQGHVFGSLGRLYSYLGDFDSAQHCLAQFLISPTLAGASTVTIEGLLLRAILAWVTGDLESAQANALESWRAAQAQDNRAQQAQALTLLGHAQLALHEVAAADTAYAQAVTLFAASDDLRGAAEARAGLADVAQRQGQSAQALALVEAILPRLAAAVPVGVDEPFYTYLICYQVLAAHADARATVILQQGYALLAAYANQITDATWRQSFLNNVPIHSRLQQAYHGETLPV